MSGTHALSVAISRRLRTETRIAAGRSLMWHCFGMASLVGLGGVGIAAALVGYSFVADPGPAAEAVAAAIADALSRTELRARASGEVRLAEGAQVALAPGGSVALEPGARVALDPNAVVRATAAAAQPRLTDTQLQPGAVAPSGAAVSTGYSIFRSAPFRSGTVITGWDYSNSDETAPRKQYCYYKEAVDDEAAVNVNLGFDGRFNDTSVQPGLDTRAAYQACTWFGE